MTFKSTRGQTLVMMALTGLLLTLMVMMTISIGTKIKEKMEVQTMADAAAYSQSVAVARTFNSVSVMNRVGVAHVTGAIAIQTLVSWSTFYHSTLYLAGLHYRFFQIQFAILTLCCIPFSGCNSFCSCAVQGVRATGSEIRSLRTENSLYTPYFRYLDLLAAFELTDYLLSADFIFYLGQLPVLFTLGSFMNNQSGANRLTNSSRNGTVYNELRVDGAPDGVNEDEIGLPMGFGITKGAIMSINPMYSHHVFAAMGSRLHPFITGRTTLFGGDASLLITTRLALLINPSNGVTGLIPGITIGSGYLSLPPGQQHGDAAPPIAWFSRFFSADDHGLLLSAYIGQLPCPIIRVAASAPYAYIYSGQVLGLHRGNNFTDAIHIIGGIARGYPWFMDYNMLKVADEDDIWGQPKVMGVVRRDLTARPFNAMDQWNPMFRFNYTPGGATYDQRGILMRDNTTSIGQQTAVSTGVTYYHRGNNAFGYHSGVEPPNFFNPYWRGGLSRLDVDNSGLNDFRRTVGGNAAAIDSFNGLRNNGFRGWQ